VTRTHGQDHGQGRRFVLARAIRSEITPEEVKRCGPNAIVATGRVGLSQNGSTTCWAFPTRPRPRGRGARTTQRVRKIAAAEAWPRAPRRDVHDEAAFAIAATLVYGPQHIIPCRSTRADKPRVRRWRRRRMKTGVAPHRIENLEAYRQKLSERLNPSASVFQAITVKVAPNPSMWVFGRRGRESSSARPGLSRKKAWAGLYRRTRGGRTRKPIAPAGPEDGRGEIRRSAARAEASPTSSYARCAPASRKGHALPRHARGVVQRPHTYLPLRSWRRARPMPW